MRISDWSSDVCSSDLLAHVLAQCPVKPVDRHEGKAVDLDVIGHLLDGHLRGEQFGAFGRVDALKTAVAGRQSEGCRVGKEGVIPCRSRGSPCHQTIKQNGLSTYFIQPITNLPP